jgi:hypothetical protein
MTGHEVWLDAQTRRMACSCGWRSDDPVGAWRVPATAQAARHLADMGGVYSR